MTGQSTTTVFIFLKCFWKENCFKIKLNKMIYKITLLPLHWGSGRDNIHYATSKLDALGVKLPTRINSALTELKQCSLNHYKVVGE